MYKLKNRIRSIRNIIANAMSTSVAFSNKVMDTRLPLPVGRGDKSDVCSIGRSMIEMLGVLAIIAVLSVGGIAGYSKAMEKWKVNKAIGEYSYLIQGLLEHIDNIRKMPNNTGLVNVVDAKGLVPASWKKSGPRDMTDNNGNRIRIFSRNQYLVIDMYLGELKQNSEGKLLSPSFSSAFCTELMQNVVYPLQDALSYAWFTNSGTSYWGNSYCVNGRKCIRDLSLAEINKICNYCKAEAGSPCGLILEF